MRFIDLKALNALSTLLDKIKDLQCKHDNPKWNVTISFRGSGWKDEAEITDEDFIKAVTTMLRDQQSKVMKRIEALGVKTS